MGTGTSARPGPSPAEGFVFGHRPELDGLRGIAILVVMIFHLPVCAPYCLTGGFLGVDLFFVLSGFLITSLLVHEWQRAGSIRLGRFYMRRLLRLMPALLVMVLACTLCVTWWGTEDERRAIVPAAVAAVFYQTNWLIVLKPEHVGGILSHTWSLSVEEHFYLLWPLTLAALLAWRVAPRRLALLILLGILASGTLRYVLCHSDKLITLNTLHACACLDTRADALLSGCLVGVLTAFNLFPRARLTRPLLQGAALVSVGGVAFLVVEGAAWIFPLFRGLFTAVAAACAVIIAALCYRPIPLARALLSFAPLTWVGRISYGLYLWHVPIAVFLSASRLACSPATAARLQFAASFVVATASFYGIERPFLRLKRHFGAADARLGAPAAAGVDAPSLATRPWPGLFLTPRRPHRPPWQDDRRKET